ncbi:putative mediator of RNA polymerase II transcription subunit 26 isoform X2 [Phlebotomus papatasi]|uniref:putative mediator of RNA polymerase II transcription subunit 26 isoform X2 n=1 Tax=Phlebotomus papatasi TaxID=29031 RepID=UPI002484141B|nr:putative mediator of RNA polymerase II transcription subunit 26 isoform X2 [Phlebotomus papatasi]XP_055712832.1 putative mediator of RNA polymerase II transcription subunit 26 isoform X2 [Phlebotomus papatasi]
MNGMTNSDEVVECPLCMEALEVDDLNFFPCTCGYQICRFCWHRIRTDENELCPACRKAYSENPADFTPLSQEQIAALKAEKRQREQQRKQKVTENRKHLANVRVVQKNLVFVVGLPPRLADAEILKKHEYFGKYGKIHKVVINPSTTYAGVQGPSASAYVTYVSNSDALRAIQSVNSIMIDNRLIKTSLGTTKYCSHFMKNQQCPKPDCMYLHELGDSEASFTKEEMHQGKHQEYEKRLHDQLIAQSTVLNSNASSNNIATGNGTKTVSEAKNIGTQNGPTKDAWPSLSESPVGKDIKMNGKIGGGNHKEHSMKHDNRKHEKTKGEKKGKNQKIHVNPHNHNNNISNNNTNNAKDQHSMRQQQQQQQDIIEKQNHISADDDEVNLIDDIEQDVLLVENDRNGDTPSLSSSRTSTSNTGDSGASSESGSGKSSPASSFPDHSHQNLSTSVSSTLSSASSASTTASSEVATNQQVQQQNRANLDKTKQHSDSTHFATSEQINGNSGNGGVVRDATTKFTKLSLFDDSNSFFSTNTFQPYMKVDGTQSNTSQHPEHVNGVNRSTPPTQSQPEQTAGTSNSQQPPQMNENILANTCEDWEAAFKYVMLKNNSKHTDEQQEELFRMQEMQKLSSVNGIRMGQQHQQYNGLHGDFNSDFFHCSNEINRQLLQHQQHSRTQHNNLHSGNENMNHMYTGNMSKFFDFHKNQQNQQQQQYMMNGHSTNGPSVDQLNMANLVENNRLNSQFMEQHGHLVSQLPKQSWLNKMDTQQQQQPQQQSHNMLFNSTPQNRLHNQYGTQNSAVIDDDLGFDPFIETQKALAELMECEMVQNKPQTNHSKLLENCQRTRMPPPGFNHMNAFGFGIPRAQGSKILPFMNMGNSTQQQPPDTNWGYMNGYPQGPQSNDQIISQSQQQNSHSTLKSNYGSMTSDWTSLDPAIVSFRQYPTLLSGPTLQQQQAQSQAPQTSDLFLSQQQQHNGPGFTHHGINLQSSIMNQQPPQQNSPAQVNAHVQGMLEYLKNRHFV